MSCLCGFVSANPIDDIYNIIFPETTPEVIPITTAIDQQQISNTYHHANITETSQSGNKIHVEYTMSEIPKDGGITVELFCKDNVGYTISVWGGSATKTNGAFDFSIKDINRENIDGCYFAVMDTTAEMGAQ